MYDGCLLQPLNMYVSWFTQLYIIDFNLKKLNYLIISFPFSLEYLGKRELVLIIS